MEKQILEILTSLSRQMDTMNERMDTMSEQMDKMDDKLEAMDMKIDTKIDEVHARLDQDFLEIGGLFEVAEKRFDVVNQRLLSIEELAKRTAMRDVKYLIHKVSQIEQDVFLLNAND
ncbi:hypothetical protein [Sporosarcina sp. FSL K6-3457]|uniref:hypothetical protein n=1 Tax=Sporosarcina sp. FSL K6-3457 TaxID=2978204 RepID=UPI0030FB4C7D